MLKKLIFIIFAIAIAAPQTSFAAFGDTKTYWGKIYSGDGKNPKKAYLDTPQDFAKDRQGNFYIADTLNQVIRKINVKTNKISTLTGTGDFGQIDGPWNRATFGFPEGVDVDSRGNVYIADTANGKIRKYDKRTGVVSTIIDGLSRPKDVMSRNSEIYIADNGNNRILRAANNGTGITTIAEISTPRKLAWRGDMLFVASEDLKAVIGISLRTGQRLTLFTGANNFGGLNIWRSYLYIVESDNGVYNRLWRINLVTRKKTRLHNILETELLNYPAQILIKEKKVTKTIKQKVKKGKKTTTVSKKVLAFEPELYILYSGGSSIYKFAKTGKKKSKKRYAGKHRFAQKMGNRKWAELGRPKDMALAPDQKVYISANNQIFVYDFKNQQLKHLVGHPMDSYTEGRGKKVRLSDPTGITLGGNGTILYIIDRNNNRVRKLDVTKKKTSYITGAGEINSSNDSDNGYTEGGPCKNEKRQGVAGCAYFNRPTGIALSKDEKTLYIADASNNRVRKVNIATGRTSLLAGSGAYGYADGTGGAAQFRGPYSLALHADGKTLYVADKYNHAIRTINVNTGRVDTLVGGPRMAGYAEGSLWGARLSIPEYLKFGPDGNLYFSEAGNLRLRMVDFGAWQTRLVSGSGKRGYQNGARQYARFNNPKGFIFAFGKIYLADFYNDLVREIAR